MTDELDGVRRYVNGIDPPDARTMAEVRDRLSAPWRRQWNHTVRSGRFTMFGRFAGRWPSSSCSPWVLRFLCRPSVIAPRVTAVVPTCKIASLSSLWTMSTSRWPREVMT